MPTDRPSEDPKMIWQNQPTEASPVSLIFVRQRARHLNAKARRQKVGALITPLIVALFYSVSIKQFPDLRRVLQWLFAFALAWSVLGLYHLTRQKSATLPENAGFSSGLEFCRREIERQSQYFHRDLQWSFGPILLAIGTFATALAVVAGPAFFLKAMPFLLLVVSWIIAYFFVRLRQQRELQRELKDLNDVESAGSH